MKSVCLLRVPSAVTHSEPELLPLPRGCALGGTAQLVPQGTGWGWRLWRDLKRRDTGLMTRGNPLPPRAAPPASSVAGRTCKWKGNVLRWGSVCSLRVSGMLAFGTCVVCVQSFEIWHFHGPKEHTKGAVGKATCSLCAGRGGPWRLIYCCSRS